MVTEWALAKVNLCLHVVGQRADGYHLLDSVVAFPGIGDKLSASMAGVSALTLEGRFGPSVPADMDNLVLRAASAVAPDTPVAFTLTKNLPPASGIGGGSADAAAAIRAVLRLQDKAEDGLSPEEILAKVDVKALQALGADVAVCLASHPARMRGTGERLDWLTQFPEGWITLVNPLVEVPTPTVFRNLVQKTNAPLPETLPDWPDMKALADWLHDQRNDLEAPALVHAPVIASVLSALAARPGALIARMSGSGATCFALFDTEVAANDAKRAITTDNPGWWAANGRLPQGRPDLNQLIRATT